MGKMHDDEAAIDPSLVRRLVAGQMPDWVDLSLERVPSAGTVNALFRLGDDMVVRLPRRHGRDTDIEKETRWLPWLAPRLPLEIPVPVAAGFPAEGYPSRWAVLRWIEGDTASIDRIGDADEAATDLARFIATLRGIDPSGGPPPGEHNYWRGCPLEDRDQNVRDAIRLLEGVLDTEAAISVWERALEAPTWSALPVWIHGDLLSENLLATGGRLSAVIDWGALGVGDPACDVMAAWTFVPADSRGAFRTAVGVDDATWARGRGWALSFGLIALPYYQDTNPVVAGIARRAIDEALADRDE